MTEFLVRDRSKSRRRVTRQSRPRAHIWLDDDTACQVWSTGGLDLNECAKNGIRTWQVAKAVVAQTGLGAASIRSKRVMKTLANGVSELRK